MENDEKIIQVDNLKYVEPQQSANTLFKFMKKLEYLKLIIENGAIIPRYNIEIIDYLGLQIIDEIAFPMSCFCDINLTKLSLHAEKYGYYGIGLKKESIYKNIDIEPIHYVNSKSNEINDFREAFSIALKESEESEQALANYLLTSLLYMKPIQGYMYNNDEKELLCFHDEREWRYIPKINDNELTHILWGNNLTREYIELSNKVLANKNKYWLKFNTKDVNYIIVKDEKECIELAEYICKLKKYNQKQKMSLISKIIVLDNLGKDW